MSEVVHDSLPQELVSPNSVATYLAASGWELAFSDPSRMVWHLREGVSGRVSIMLPLDNSYVDYADRLDEALTKLCQVYNWGIEQLVSDILQSRSDLLLIRADQATFNDSIPLLQAQQLLSGSVDMLLAAARATVSPRASFRGNYPELARDFLNQDVRMGHTRRGSFVLTILTSLTDHDDQTDATSTASLDHAPSVDDSGLTSETERTGSATSTPLTQEAGDAGVAGGVAGSPDEVVQDEVIPPFQRRVLTTLARGLEATRDISRPKPTIDIETAVTRGVSSNLLDSLSEMSKFEGLRALDISFQWSPSEPNTGGEPTEVVLPRAQLLQLKTTSEQLKAAPETERVTLFGRVVRVDVDDEKNAPGEGVVAVRGVTGRSDRKTARVLVGGGNYVVAYRALRSRQPILVTGTLEKIKGVWWLTGDVRIEDAHSG